MDGANSEIEPLPVVSERETPGQLIWAMSLAVGALWIAAAALTLLVLVVGAAGLAWDRSRDQSRAIPLPPAPVQVAAPTPSAPPTPAAVDSTGGVAGQPPAVAAGESAPGSSAGEGEERGSAPSAARPLPRPGRGEQRRRADLVRDPGF